MTSRILSRQDLDFLLFDWLDVDALTQRSRFSAHDRESFGAAISLYQRIAEQDFAPHNRSNDLNEPSFDGENIRVNPPIVVALRRFREAGLTAAGFDYDLGGMQLPSVIERAGAAWLQAANPATCVYPYLAIANANLLFAHASPAQIARYALPLIEGRWMGTMCLSEPQAGSSLGDVVARAEPQSDGSYRLFGTKMWISAADHDLAENIVHLVLARVPGDPLGVKGLSLFIVSKFLIGDDESLREPNDVAVAGLNHKMGYRGATNCALNFGEGRRTPGGRPGAIGELVGETGRGLEYMFHMMNEARIAVGLGGATLGYTGYLHALGYARERPQGRLIGDRAPARPQVAIIEHPDVRRMLLAQKAYAEGALALNLYCARLLDDQNTAPDEADRRDAALLLDLLTPIAKSWPAQWCVEANSLAIQVLGGYGYTRDFPVEQFYRDNRLNQIHEGTHGIQGLDLLGRKVATAGGAAFGLFEARLVNTADRARSMGDADLTAMADELDASRRDLIETTAGLRERWDVAYANASVYLEAFGHIVLAWIWLEQALAAHGRTDDFGRGKRQAALWFFRWELPKTGPQLALLKTLDRTALEMNESWF